MRAISFSCRAKQGNAVNNTVPAAQCSLTASKRFKGEAPSHSHCKMCTPPACITSHVPHHVLANLRREQHREPLLLAIRCAHHLAVDHRRFACLGMRVAWPNSVDLDICKAGSSGDRDNSQIKHNTTQQRDALVGPAGRRGGQARRHEGASQVEKHSTSCTKLYYGPCIRRIQSLRLTLLACAACGEEFFVDERAPAAHISWVSWVVIA